MKKCPYCAAEIADDVAKCKHCGEWVNQAGVPPAGGGDHTVNIRYEPSEFHKKVFKGVFAYIVISGIVGLVIFAVFFFAIWLPGWNQVQERHDQFDKDFQQRQKEFDRKWKDSR